MNYHRCVKLCYANYEAAALVSLKLGTPYTNSHSFASNISKIFTSHSYNAKYLCSFQEWNGRYKYDQLVD